MGKWLYNLVAMALFLAVPVFAETTYNYLVTDTGETEAEIFRDTEVKVVFPLDVPSVAEDQISYTSLYHTRKEQGVWYFETTIPHADYVTLTLPQSVHVVQSIPTATFTKTNVWQLTWSNISENISVSYVSTKAVAAAPSIPPNLPTLPVVIILAVIALAAYLHSRHTQKTEHAPRKTKTSEPNVTEGQLNILRAANTNEALVIRTVLAHNGHMKRNMLERETKLSKSSLASTLKNLERKKIVTIDRTFFVHYIGLTPWFKEL